MHVRNVRQNNVRYISKYVIAGCIVISHLVFEYSMSYVAGIEVLETHAGNDVKYLGLTFTRTRVHPVQRCCTHVLLAVHLQLVDRQISTSLRHAAATARYCIVAVVCSIEEEEYLYGAISAPGSHLNE